MKKIIILLLAVLAFQNTDASHVAGGEIWYEHDTLNTYTVKFRFYRDCWGIQSPQTLSMYYKSTSLTVGPQTVAMTLDTSYQASTCAVNSCNNPSASLPGAEISEYSAQVTLSAAASDWYFYTYVSARNISNNIQGGSLYVDATLDNLNTPFNNATVPYAPIDMVQFFNTQKTMHLPLVDVDGDSLDMYFVSPQTGSSSGNPSNINYLSPYTVTNPFNSTPAPLLNPSNGNLTLYNAAIGTLSFAVRIDEYRNGVKIASTGRDYLFWYNSNIANVSPSLSGVNNTTSYTTSINVCPSASLSFTVNSSDPDATDSTWIEQIYVPAGASFNTNNAQNQVGTFTWAPTLAEAQSQPYLVSFKVRDNNCSEQSYAYQVYVNNCNPDSVWAGDANADFTCDNYDVLNIGIANAQTGPVRAGATTNWQAEWCANWANNFVSNINQKHADCNGDGVVNSLDLAAVTANYGLVHQKNAQVGQYKTLGLPDLYCDVSNVQAHKGSTVTIPVMLGTIGSEINDFYGISATVELLNAQTSAPIAVSKNVSWIGNATNSFEFEKNLAPNKSAFTFVRNDQQNLMNQQGQIGEISFPIDGASLTGSKVIVQFSDIKMIKNSGEEITDFNVLSDSLEILAPNSIGEFDKHTTVSIYPNPTKSTATLSITVTQMQEYHIALFDAVGRLIKNRVFNGRLNSGEHTIDLDLNGVSTGHYLLEIKAENGRKLIPIQKM